MSAPRPTPLTEDLIAAWKAALPIRGRSDLAYQRGLLADRLEVLETALKFAGAALEAERAERAALADDYAALELYAAAADAACEDALKQAHAVREARRMLERP